MKHIIILQCSITILLAGCGGSSGSTGNSPNNRLTVALTSENAPRAAELSLMAPSAVQGLLDGMVNDIPEEAVNAVEARTAARVAGRAETMAASREEESCTNGGTVAIEESDATISIIFNNCTETQSIEASEDYPAYSITDVTDGTISFSDSSMDGYPEAELVTLNLTNSTIDTEGQDNHETQNGSFVTGYSDTGYAIKEMNLSARYWGKQDSDSPSYDYSIATQDFSVTVDGTTEQTTMSGLVTATGTDESSDPMLGGTFKVETTAPINSDQTQGEYRISGTNNSSVVTRLDPAGIYIETNGGAAEFYAWEDANEYFDDEDTSQ